MSSTGNAITNPPPTSAPPNVASPNASWMSGKHGISYRVPGGTHHATTHFFLSKLAEQIKDLPISYFIFGLSSGAAGDRYLAPHPKFKELGMRAVTPKAANTDFYNPYYATTDQLQNYDLDSLDDIDVFDNFLTKMEKDLQNSNMEKVRPLITLEIEWATILEDTL